MKIIRKYTKEYEELLRKREKETQQAEEELIREFLEFSKNRRYLLTKI